MQVSTQVTESAANDDSDRQHSQHPSDLGAPARANFGLFSRSNRVYCLVNPCLPSRQIQVPSRGVLSSSNERGIAIEAGKIHPNNSWVNTRGGTPGCATSSASARGAGSRLLDRGARARGPGGVPAWLTLRCPSQSERRSQKPDVARGVNSVSIFGNSRMPLSSSEIESAMRRCAS